MSCKRNQLALAIGALLSAGIANTAFAQTAEPAATSADTTTQDPKTMDPVTVTGSHIKRAQISGVGPVTVIDRESIERSGAISVETLLQRLPAAAGLPGQPTNTYRASNGYRPPHVHQRGLARHP